MGAIIPSLVTMVAILAADGLTLRARRSDEPPKHSNSADEEWNARAETPIPFGDKSSFVKTDASELDSLDRISGAETTANWSGQTSILSKDSR